ncbi:hypothetical protein B0H13DRAFT_1053256 [Mycena leptocephala]|nr:hypothetical protein B0H13DRAFT_1053256 [Mycena leptocephala]
MVIVPSAPSQKEIDVVRPGYSEGRWATSSIEGKNVASRALRSHAEVVQQCASSSSSCARSTKLRTTMVSLRAEIHPPPSAIASSPEPQDRHRLYSVCRASLSKPGAYVSGISIIGIRDSVRGAQGSVPARLRERQPRSSSCAFEGTTTSISTSAAPKLRSSGLDVRIRGLYPHCIPLIFTADVGSSPPSVGA